MTEYGSGGSYTVSMEGPYSGGGGSALKLAVISAPAANWKGGESPYSQVVSVDGVSTGSKVDLQLSVEQMELFRDSDIAFTTENESGIVTLYAVGDKPAEDLEIQATLSEVVILDSSQTVIRGNTVSTNMPQTDYAQTDSTKGDFLKNKPDAAIATAQRTADDAQDAADEAMALAQKAMTKNPRSIELYPEAIAGHGGFIDFHYNGSTEDYTSRVIESKKGELIVNGVRFKDGKVYSQSIESEAWNGDTIPVSMGGTGATDAATARTNLGACSIEGYDVTDCNEARTFGHYRVFANTLNTPVTPDNGHVMLVIHWDLNTGVQIYSDPYNQKLYTRTYRNANGAYFEPWYEIYTGANPVVLNSNHYGDALPSSGVTGQVFYLKG